MVNSMWWRVLWSSAGCAVVMFIVYVTADVSIWLIAFLGTATYTIIYFVFLFIYKEEKTINKLEGESSYRQTIMESEAKIIRIREMALQVLDFQTKAQILKICRISASIIEKVKADPDRIRLIKRYFDYYIDATHNIIEQYVFLLDAGVKSKEAKDNLKKAEELLLRIASTFDIHLARVLDNDLLEMSVEIRTMDKLMNQEEAKHVKP